MYDSEKHLYLVKRKNGRVEYFANMHDFQSLPRFDLRALKKVPFYNLGNNGSASDFSEFLKRECNNDFKTMKTAQCKKVTSKYIIDRITKKPLIMEIYPPPKMVDCVPVHKGLLDNSLSKLECWSYSPFGKEDMLGLSKQRLFVTEENEKDTKSFIKVLETALVQGLYAGSGNHSADVEIL
ncbi:hypothetical protein L1987_86088 [Smallanthus sonchifolius]|uniref:Uncharacterized protein n=1 Tax=Smallanthus sonchifolius TaxID=185202 RepID=A0ACB8XXM6_9ASTR|nr:hypothetical protein L1987_86088 [Smallanthus sonchifolius]